ncbi:MFS transporter [Streptomyces sp. WAC05858]|uniref:MFS transporter n=1 Tax=Streptomyces mordarskii TaxID=1226758 RepID=A0ABP3MV34_9ACTN|nr:MFS transporter [Streptomyces sp. WAC05858]
MRIAGEPPRPVADAGDTKKQAGVPLRRQRDFVLLWSGAGLTLLGARAGSVAYPLLLIWSTGSASAAAVAGFAAQLPQLLVQLPAGALVDRWDRRRLMIGCSAGCAVSATSVLVAVACGQVWLAHLAVAAFVEGSLMVCYRLAERAGVRHVVPPGQLTAALAGNEARGRAAGIIGQPVGSGTFTLARWAPFGVAAVAHVCALVAVLLIRKPFQDEPVDRPRRFVPEIAEGVRWLWRQVFLRQTTLLISGSNVIFQALTLLPALVLYEEGASAATVGVIAAVSGVGGACGALCGGWFARRFRLSAMVRLGFAGWALLVPCLALTRSPLVLGMLLAGVNFAGGAINVAGGVYQVRITPDALQGRVNSVLQLIGSGANSLGVLAGGLLLDASGAAGTALGLGAAMALLALTAALSPTVRRGETAVGPFEKSVCHHESTMKKE